MLPALTLTAAKDGDVIGQRPDDIELSSVGARSGEPCRFAGDSFCGLAAGLAPGAGRVTAAAAIGALLLLDRVGSPATYWPVPGAG